MDRYSSYSSSAGRGGDAFSPPGFEAVADVLRGRRDEVLQAVRERSTGFRAVGTSGAGMVRVAVNASCQLLSLHMDADFKAAMLKTAAAGGDAANSEAAVLEDLVRTAWNGAVDDLNRMYADTFLQVATELVGKLSGDDMARLSASALQWFSKKK